MRKYFAGVVGNLLEHYDQALYGFLVPFLAPLFFPAADPVYAMIAAYALLPLGLVSKPIGALFFGWLGDRLGRGKILSITLLGMAATTAAMGCLPTYELAGWVAPALLALGRLLQNFFAAGETTGGALYLLEQTQQSRRGWISSLFDMSSIIGIMFASAAAMLWGESWRWLYWTGALTALSGFAVRKSVMQEKPVLLQPKMRELFGQWRAILSISLVIGFSYGNYYLITNMFNSFLPIVSQISTREALAMNTAMLFLDMMALPFFGWLSIYISKERLMLGALVAGIIFSLPFYQILGGASASMAAGVRIALMLIGVCFSATYHAWAMDQCSERLRFTVCAMGFAIGSRLIGGLMPSLSLWCYHKTEWTGAAAIPIIAAGLLALVPLLKPQTQPGSQSSTS